MRLVLLYGPPGVGKLSVGQELADMTGFKLFYNHLSSNLVSAVFPLDSDVFHPLVRRIRRDVIAEAAREEIDLIHTGAYKGIEDRDTIPVPRRTRMGMWKKRPIRPFDR